MSKAAAEPKAFPPSLGKPSPLAAATKAPPDIVNGVHQLVEQVRRKSGSGSEGATSSRDDSGDSKLFDHIHAGAVKATSPSSEEKAATTTIQRTEVRKDKSPGRQSIIGDVLQNIAAGDEEGRSRQRILAFAAKRYATAVEKNPQDADALYNWALVLQESADSIGTETGPAEKDALLEEACKKYEAATKFCPTLHEAYYNWGIAVSDRAKLRGRTKEAEELWKQACQKYDRSVQLNWSSPQALNNWGLALQELGAIVPLKEKRAIVKVAIKKFRAAIRLRFDFHRAVYNLGTVLYGLAEDTLRSGRRPSTHEGSSSELYSASAVYITAAHSLKPEYSVYRSALRLVRSMLPLPYLKVGYLTVPPKGDSLAPHSDWVKQWFVLDHEALYQTERVDNNRSPALGASSSPGRTPQEAEAHQKRVSMQEIVCVSPTADLSLPPGGCFVIDTPSGEHFMIAENWEAVDGWVDAIRLVYTIFVRGKSEALATVLTA